MSYLSPRKVARTNGLQLGVAFILFVWGAAYASAKETDSPSAPPPASQAAPIVRAEPAPQSPAQPQEQVPGAPYDKSIFQNTIPASDLAFLSQFAGASSGDLFHDKQFRKVVKNALPNCEFHYGRDMSLWDALEMVFDGSLDPVQIREGRYVSVSGRRGPFLNGRGFLWIDMQDGIVLGGFYFTPTNGEPTPAMNIFSRQIGTTPSA